MPLTGRFNLRRTIGGKIVLQVEEEVRRLWPFSRNQLTKRRWRDATIMDLAQPELRPLMDLRYKSGFEWARVYGQLGPARQDGSVGSASSQDNPSLAVAPEPSVKANAAMSAPQGVPA
ncbi:hypothetical protein [Microvirga pakistanensis]|uniref:hypothetical protein n=1 Tax=Microvirga pakistanensis TaxID=1682650 RepID=UPI0018741E2D|nr:hypothetical protein [Microvirga pakistanensis]